MISHLSTHHHKQTSLTKNKPLHKSLLSFILVLLLAAPAALAATVYVNASVSGGTGNGSTWANAYATLQPAINAAQSGDQIWVAQGTYKPTTSTADRTASFVMKQGVIIYGGFPPLGGSLPQRDPAINETVLSGDIDNDGTLAGNSYHVVFNNNNGLTAAAVLDGFTVTGGNANGADADAFGGGMFCIGSSPKIANCLFSDNAASLSNGYGGGMALQNSSNIELVSCAFKSNAAFNGAGLFSEGGSSTLTNCSFLNNSASASGGGHEQHCQQPHADQLLVPEQLRLCRGGHV